MTHLHFGWVDKAQTALNSGCLSRDWSLPCVGPSEGGEIYLLFDNKGMDWRISRGHFLLKSSIHNSHMNNGADGGHKHQVTPGCPWRAEGDLQILLSSFRSVRYGSSSPFSGGVGKGGRFAIGTMFLSLLLFVFLSLQSSFSAFFLSGSQPFFFFN